MSDEQRDDEPRGLHRGLTQYGDLEFSLFLRRAFIKGAGYTDDALTRPVVGIANTASGYNPCHGNAPQLVEAIRRGVMLAGGLNRADSQYTSMGFAQLRALSPSGRCSPFDAKSDGLMVGEGAGIFVLKRLGDAERDGDTVHGVLAGWGEIMDRLLGPKGGVVFTIDPEAGGV